MYQPDKLRGHQTSPRKMKKKTARSISTDSIETALEQLVRTRTAGIKASIKPIFVIEVLKELLHWRREDRSLRSEVNSLFSDELILMDNASDKPLRVVEIGSLSELGNSSHAGFDLRKAEWKLPTEAEPPPELDESDVTYETHHKPILRTKHSSGSGMVHGRWEDGSSTRKSIIYVLLTVIALTFGSLMLV